MDSLGHPVIILIGLKVKEITNFGSGSTIRLEGQLAGSTQVARVKFDLPVQDAIADIEGALYGVAVEYLGQEEPKGG